MKQEMKNERRKHIEVRRKLVKKLEYRKLMKKENGIKLNVKYQNQKYIRRDKVLNRHCLWWNPYRGQIWSTFSELKENENVITMFKKGDGGFRGQRVEIQHEEN